MEATLTRTRMLGARSADARLLRRLEAGRLHGRVHSLFDRVANIEDSAGDLFTLAGRGLDNAPATIVVDLESFEAVGLAVDDRVIASGRTLKLGRAIEIRLAACAAWDARLPAYPRNCAQLPARLCEARTVLECHGRGGGMVARREVQGEFARAIETALAQRSSRLLEALARADFASACAHAASMIGLGPGLTPSGDDFLLGLFAVLNIPDSPCNGWLGGGAEVVARAGQATNAISLAALTHAARGHVRESVLDLIECLLLGPTDDVAASMRRVLAIGSTSGADIACGLLAGLELNLKHMTNRGFPSCPSKW
jgi:hypothetical protein